MKIIVHIAALKITKIQLKLLTDMDILMEKNKWRNYSFHTSVCEDLQKIFNWIFKVSEY